MHSLAPYQKVGRLRGKMDIKEEANRILTIPILYRNFIHKNIHFKHINSKKKIFLLNTIERTHLIRFQIFLVLSTDTILNKIITKFLRGGAIFE